MSKMGLYPRVASAITIGSLLMASCFAGNAKSTETPESLPKFPTAQAPDGQVCIRERMWNKYALVPGESLEVGGYGFFRPVEDLIIYAKPGEELDQIPQTFDGNPYSRYISSNIEVAIDELGNVFVMVNQGFLCGQNAFSSGDATW
jgi:hypothetical protein